MLTALPQNMVETFGSQISKRQKISRIRYKFDSTGSIINALNTGLTEILCTDRHKLLPKHIFTVPKSSPEEAQQSWTYVY